MGNDILANISLLENLCEKIGMPKEVTQKVLDISKSYDFSVITEFSHNLRDIATAHIAFEGISKLIENESERGFIWLTISLMVALDTHKNYAQMGIDDKIFYDTMACFTRFVNEHKDSYGKYGFDRAFWTYRQLSQTIYRIGTLEFELFTHSGDEISLDGKAIIKEGDKYLSIHIPSDAKTNKENCENSYKMANLFFGNIYPSFEYKYLYCNTWLLSPTLEKVLKQGSNILQFQSDFTICNFFEEDVSYKLWVFKDEKLEIENLPENTSLQRNIKTHLLSGGKVGSADGVIAKNKF